MNDHAKSWTSIELDRLVDGELEGGEYQELLRRLDAAPDGWKQCALAFLEAQALRHDLAGLTREAAPHKAPSSTVRAASMIPSWFWPLAVAACLLGMLAMQPTKNQRPSSQTAPPSPPPLAARDQSPDNTPVANSQPDGHLVLTVDDGSKPAGRELSIPVYSPANYPQDDPNQMSPELQDFLKKRGGVVGAERIWQHVENEGQVYLVPIDRYFVRPARAY